MASLMKTFKPLELGVMGILLALAVVGLVTRGYQISQGLIVTNMRTKVL
jgi:hypothetical protein